MQCSSRRPALLTMNREPPPVDEPPLVRRAAHALAWSYALTLAKSVLAFALSVVLARLLGPAPFGLVAAALLVVSPGMLLVEAGAGPALIQRETLDEDAVACAFTWQLLAGLALTLGTVVAAPLLAALLNTPGLTPVLRAMAPAFMLQSFGLVSTALLRRDLRHRDVLIAITVTYAIAYGMVGLPLALNGAGVWALVSAQLAQAGLASAILFSLRPVRRCWRAPWRDGALLRFSNQVLQVNGLNWMIENGDNLVIGRLFGAPVLGLYSRAYATLRLPADSLMSALQAVTFASHSRRRDPASACRAYVATLNAVSLIALPFFAAAAVLGGPIVLALYGPAWAAAGALVTPLSLAMLFHCLVAVSGPVLWARDNVRREFLAQLLSLGVLVSALLLASASPIQVAWGVTVAYAIRGVAMTLSAARTVGVPLRDLARASASGIRPATAAALAAFAVRALVGSPLIVLCGGLAAAGVATVIALWPVRRLEWTVELATVAAALPVPGLRTRLARLSQRTLAAT